MGSRPASSAATSGSGPSAGPFGSAPADHVEVEVDEAFGRRAPRARRDEERGRAAAVAAVHVGAAREQQANDVDVAVGRGGHERRDALRAGRVRVRPAVEQGPGPGGVALEARLAELHSYDTPEIIVLRERGNEKAHESGDSEHATSIVVRADRT